MLLGYNTNGFAHHRLEDALTILAELGYQSVAITLDHHALDPSDCGSDDQLMRVKKLLHEHGLRSVIETGARFLLDPRRKHQPTLLSPSPEAERRLVFLRHAIDVAAELGSDAVSFWSGTATDPSDPQELMTRLVEHCRELCRYAAERSIRLAFEPEPGMFIDTMSQFAELHGRVGHLLFGLTLDIGHLHCLGETPIANQITHWRDWLWNVHVEDMRRGVHDHLMFGEGEIDFADVMTALNGAGYSGAVHVELSRHSHDAVETARRSLAFLRAAAGAAGAAPAE
jgi:sugar phosphate isomerase/epimerase